jgi:hypothetical protein
MATNPLIRAVSAEPLPVPPPVSASPQQQADFNHKVAEYLRRLQTRFIESIVTDTGGGGAASSEVPDIRIFTEGTEFRGNLADGRLARFVSTDCTWNTNKYDDLLLESGNSIDDMAIIHRSTTDVAVTGVADAWTITIPDQHIILDQTSGDLSGITNPATVIFRNVSGSATITFDSATTIGTTGLPAGFTRLTLANWHNINRIAKSFLSSAGLIDGDGWARFKITHVTIGTGICRLRSYGCR